MSLIKAIYAEDALIEDPYGSENKIQGEQAIEQFYQFAFESGMKATLTGPIRVAGDCAVFPFQIEFNGQLIDVIDLFQFNDSGKVINMKAFWSQEINMHPAK